MPPEGFGDLGVYEKVVHLSGFSCYNSDYLQAIMYKPRKHAQLTKGHILRSREVR